MSAILTRAELIADIDEIISKVCMEEGLDKREFLQSLADLMGMDAEVVL